MYLTNSLIASLTKLLVLSASFAKNPASSTKIMPFLELLKSSVILGAVCPIYLPMMSALLTILNTAFVIPSSVKISARSFAQVVLPVPGRPVKIKFLCIVLSLLFSLSALITARYSFTKLLNSAKPLILLSFSNALSSFSKNLPKYFSSVSSLSLSRALSLDFLTSVTILTSTSSEKSLPNILLVLNMNLLIFSSFIFSSCKSKSLLNTFS